MVSDVEHLTTFIPKLRDRMDWSQWYTRIRQLADDADVWEYVDPHGRDVYVKPVEPQMDAAEPFQRRYERRLALYTSYKKAIAKTNMAIDATVSDVLRLHIASETTPRSKIQVLKARILPNTDSEKLVAEQRYASVIAESGVQDWLSWSARYSKAVADCQSLKVTRIEEDGMWRDFCSALEDSWPYTRAQKLVENPNNATPITDIIARFLTYIQSYQQSHGKKTNVTNNVNRAKGGESKSGDKEKKKCPCGAHLQSKQHWWTDCFFFRWLHNNNPKPGWTPKNEGRSPRGVSSGGLAPIQTTRSLPWRGSQLGRTSLFQTRLRRPPLLTPYSLPRWPTMLRRARMQHSAPQ